jgi:solute carrier family 35 (adenosine 3'-phospho 5'-phosphosulfate transporter), member B2
VYGVLQERMMTVGFGPNRELFKSSLFMVFCNRLLTSGISLLVALMQPDSVRPVAPLQSYAAVSFANLVASTCQYDSLKYVSFALQTLAKCCKMLPVMVWGVIIRKKRYNLTEVSTAACVVAGCAAFIFSGNVLSRTVDAALSMRWYGIGCALLLLYLAFDGFASTWQDTLFSGYEMDTSNQVLYTSLCSMLMSLVVLLISGEMWRAGGFLLRHPPAMAYITAVSSVATIIQYFVAYTIKTYGALNFAALMTARQFLSVIASCVIFKHRFTAGQWCVTFAIQISRFYNRSYLPGRHLRACAQLCDSVAASYVHFTCVCILCTVWTYVVSNGSIGLSNTDGTVTPNKLVGDKTTSAPALCHLCCDMFACRVGTFVVFGTLAYNVLQKRARARADGKEMTSPFAYSPQRPPAPLPTRSGHVSDELVTFAKLLPAWPPHTPAGREPRASTEDLILANGSA